MEICGVTLRSPFFEDWNDGMEEACIGDVGFCTRKRLEFFSRIGGDAWGRRFFRVLFEVWKDGSNMRGLSTREIFE